MDTQTQTTAAPKKPAREPKPINGVDVPALFATLDAVKGMPELAKFRFRAENRWVKGTHSVTRMGPFDGAGGTHVHREAWELSGDHPAVLCGADEGPTPVELVLHALASCLVAGCGNIASARGVELRSVTATLEGDIDLRGLLGIERDAKRGYEGIRVKIAIDGDAPEEELRAIAERSRSLSAVFDILTSPTAVDVEVEVG